MNIMEKKEDIYYESESGQKESYQLMLQLQRQPPRQLRKNIQSWEMEPKQMNLQRKRENNLKKHKKINNTKEYRNDKKQLQSPSTDEKPFQDQQNENINSSSMQIVKFADIYAYPPVFIPDINQDAQEQGKSNYQENNDEKKLSSVSSQRGQKKLSKKDTKNLLQFYWNTLKNIFEQSQFKGKLTDFTVWFSKNKRKPPSMSLITELYEFKEIQHFLNNLFQAKFLHRALMLSSTKIQNKKIFFKFLRTLQRSFFKKKLDHIH